MIRLLKIGDVGNILELLKKYHETEDKNFEIVLNRNEKQLEELILNGYIYGKYEQNELIGFASMSKYNAIDGLKKTKLENRIRKEKFFKDTGINNENTAVLLNDLIDANYRGNHLYKELVSIRLDKLKELGYEHVVAYLNINKVIGINSFLKNGWEFGTLIEISENRYEFLLHYNNSCF